MCEDSKSSDDASSPDHTDDSNLSDISSPPVIPPAPELPVSFAKALPFATHIQFNQDSKVTLPQPTLPSSIPQPVANSSGITISPGAFSAGSFVTPRNNVTVSTINSSSSNKSRPKKSKPKPQPKAKVIKFHEYKGPPNIVKSTQPVSTTTTVGPVGLGTVINTASQAAARVPAAAKTSETPYHILLQQQQLFLQWQLEFSQKNLNATVIVPTQKDGQPSLQSFPSSTGNVESSPLSVITQASPQTVFTVTPTSQQSGGQVQQMRISSPVLTQVKQEPPVGQPQPQLNPNMTPINTNKIVKKHTPAVSTTGQLKQYTCLEEMKVAELKAELKKRNLTVSGPKEKLIERLKPYADAIIKAPKDKSPSGSVTSPGSSVFSPTGSVIAGMSPQPFALMSPNSAPSPQSVRLPNGVVFSAPGSVSLPIVFSSSGTFSQPGSVQSSCSSLQSPGSVNSTVTPVTSPSATGSVFSQPGSVGSVIEEIICSNAESPLPSIQSMQSAVSVSNMTMMPDDLSNPFSPPESPLVMENVMTPLSPDAMEIPVPSPANEHVSPQHQPNHIMNGPTNMEQSRPPSVVSVVPSEIDKFDMAMDIDLDLNQSLSCSLAPALNAVTLGAQMSQASEQMVNSQASQPNMATVQTDVLKSQRDDQQQMLNRIEAQLRILQEKQQQKQQQHAANTSQYQLSQEELLRQQQEKIEKLQAQLQESQLQLQLQQLQHQQLQQQQQKLQLLQQQQIQLQQQQQQVQSARQQLQQKVGGMPQVSSGAMQTGMPQAAQAVAQPLHGQPEVQQPPQGQPPVQQVQVTVQQPQVHVNSQTPRQITVQVPRSSPSVQVPTTTQSQISGVQSTVTMQKPAGKQPSSKPNPTSTPQVIFSVPNGVKAPTLGNLPANMKQIQIPASWLTNIQSTPQGMSAVIVPQAKKTKAPNLEFIKNQAINQTLNLVGGKSLIAVSTGTGGQQQLIIASTPQSKTTTPAPSSSPPAPPANGLTKTAVQKM